MRRVHCGSLGGGFPNHCFRLGGGVGEDGGWDLGLVGVGICRWIGLRLREALMFVGRGGDASRMTASSAFLSPG